MIGKMVVNCPLRSHGGILRAWLPGMPGKPEEPGPNPQSCDTDCSQSREWDCQGSLGLTFRKLREVIFRY